MLEALPQWLLNPQNVDGVIKFYFVWTFVLLGFHVVADRFSSKTPPRTLKDLGNKTSELFSAATTVASANMIVIVFNGFKTHPLFDTGFVVLPIVIYALLGLFMGLSGLALKTNRP